MGKAFCRWDLRIRMKLEASSCVRGGRPFHSQTISPSAPRAGTWNPSGRLFRPLLNIPAWNRRFYFWFAVPSTWSNNAGTALLTLVPWCNDSKLADPIWPSPHPPQSILLRLPTPSTLRAPRSHLTMLKLRSYRSVDSPPRVGAGAVRGDTRWIAVPRMQTPEKRETRSILPSVESAGN